MPSNPDRTPRRTPKARAGARAPDARAAPGLAGDVDSTDTPVSEPPPRGAARRRAVAPPAAPEEPAPLLIPTVALSAGKATARLTRLKAPADATPKTEPQATTPRSNRASRLGAAAAKAGSGSVDQGPEMATAIGAIREDVGTLAGQLLGLGSAALSAARRLRSQPAAEVKPAKPAPSPGAVQTALRRARALGRTVDALLALAPPPPPKSIWGRSGRLLRRMREQAGLTLEELGQAIDLNDPSLLAVAENGRAALPIEVVLRLASVLGRNDPLAAAVSLTRASHPQLWQSLENMGIGRLLMQSARERAFVNLLRGDDRVRQLGDAEFNDLLALVKAALQLGLNFQTATAAGAQSA